MKSLLTYVIVLTSSTARPNYVPNACNGHDDFDQYGSQSSFAIPSDIMPRYSYPASLVNQNEIPIDLSCERAHLALIMSLTSTKMLTNMTHMQHHPR